MPKTKQVNDFIIIIDKREQQPYTFSHINPRPKIEYATLREADYSIKGYEDRIGCERKNLADLFQSIGRNRERFKREFERLEKFEYAALVIEGSLSDIFLRPPAYSKMNSKAVFHTLISWSVYYKVFIWNAPDRTFAEKLTYYLLEKWWKKNVEQI